MKLGIQLYPHTNKRYYESLKTLAVKELLIILNPLISEDNIKYENIGGIDLLCFEIDTLSDDSLSRIYRHSSMLALFEINEDTLKPLMLGYNTYFNDDLAYILKYKGKTNEMFTQMMLNIGVFAGSFANRYQEPLHVLDLMCGKGTSMFMALKNGYHSAGIETNKAYHSEVENFIKRYFQFNKLKHSITRTSYDISGKKRALKFVLETADTTEHYKANDTRTLQFVLGDTRHALTYFGKKKFHVILADLPYGVQHQPEEASDSTKPKTARQKKASAQNQSTNDGIIQIIDDSLDGWLSTLKVGGIIVLAYNSNTLSRTTLKQIMEERTLSVLDMGIYKDFSHWVEQSITRDIMIIRK